MGGVKYLSMQMNELPINQIVCGECSQVMSQWPDECVDLTVTSPPYNVGIDYDNYSDNLSIDDYKAFCRRWLVELYRVTKPDGRMAINIANTGRRPYLNLTTIYDTIITDIGFVSRGQVIWDKQHKSNKTSWGSWLSASNPSLIDCHEYILIYSKSEMGKRNKGESTICKTDFVRSVESVWRFPPKSDENHPVVFPSEIPRRLIELYSFKDDIVFDPFSGSGTTCKMAMLQGRKYIGIDISEKYCKLARVRIDQHSNDFIKDIL